MITLVNTDDICQYRYDCKYYINLLPYDVHKSIIVSTREKKKTNFYIDDYTNK